MRLFFMFLAMAFSVQSFADHFVCRICVNGTCEENYAEYRERKNLVVLEYYSCSGQMVDRLVTTAIATKWDGVLVENTGDMSSESVFQDYSFKGEPLDLVTCKCGLN